MKVRQKEERRHLEDKFKSDMEAQRQQLTNMMNANMEELQKERESVLAQNRSLQQAVQGMERSLNARNGEITNLQRQIKQIANRPPPRRRKKKRCVLM